MSTAKTKFVGNFDPEPWMIGEKTQFLPGDTRPLTDDEIYEHIGPHAEPEIVRELGWTYVLTYKCISNKDGKPKGMIYETLPEFPTLLIQNGEYAKLHHRYNPGDAINNLPRKILAVPYKTFDWQMMVNLDHLQKLHKTQEETATKRMRENPHADLTDLLVVYKADQCGSVQYRFPRIVIAAGDRDAANVASCDELVVWQNQEKEISPATYSALKKIAHEVIYLGDIDKTGKEKAHANCLRYLDMIRVDIPVSPDYIGKAYKDVTDYLSTFQHLNGAQKRDELKIKYARNQIKQLIHSGRKYQIYTYVSKKGGGYKVEIIKDYIGPFLRNCGFSWIKDENEEIWLSHQIGNVIHKINKGQAKRWLIDFYDRRNSKLEVREAIKRSPFINQAIDEDIPMKEELDTRRGHATHQVMVFDSQIWHVYPNEIKVFQPGKTSDVVLKKQVMTPHLKKGTPFYLRAMDPMWKITQSETGKFDIEILNESSFMLRMLMCQSMVHWRQAFDRAVPRLPLDESLTWETLLEKKLHPLTSEYLTEAEKDEHKLHLINKLHSGGYNLYTHKDMANAYCPLDTDYQLGLNKESNGRTGKSLYTAFLQQFLITDSVNARDRHVFERPHVGGTITKFTEIFSINDAGMSTDYDFLYDFIAGPMVVNPKNQAQRTIPFEDSPKLRVNTNFVPYNLDPSTLDRFQFSLFSDFFSAGRQDSKPRRPSDFFKKTFITGWTPEEWIVEINFAAQICQVAQTYKRINPPMEQIMRRNAQNKIGDEFSKWIEENLSELINDDRGLGKIPVRKDEDQVEDFGTPIVNAGFAREIKGAIYINSNAAFSQWQKDSGKSKHPNSQNKFNEAVKEWAAVKNGFTFDPERVCDSGKKAPFKTFDYGGENKLFRAFYISRESLAKGTDKLKMTSEKAEWDNPEAKAPFE